MKIAAIDIGTNSTKITLADCDAGVVQRIAYEDSEITRLGQGVDKTGSLSAEAMERTAAAVERFAAKARSSGADKIVAAGTSALRDASNGQEFLRRVKERSGLEVEIITGDREAQLAYLAVWRDRDLRLVHDEQILVFDIGGGSTELILGQEENVLRHVSLNIGAVRLTERFLRADPPTEEEISRATAAVDGLLQSFAAGDQPWRIVGIGGTAVNLASVTRGLTTTDPDAVHAATLSAVDVDSALTRFRAVRLADRRQIPGLEPGRADVIIAGALILSRLLARFSADRCTVSARGLRYGFLAEAANQAV